MSSESNFRDPRQSRPTAPDEEPFAGLSPDVVLNAIDDALEAGGPLGRVRTSGQVLALNSYENRVFQVGLETAAAPQPAAPVVVKFYRPR
ncbi:MAG TPA: hypothetical protein VEE84_02370, partial [Burkholderiaceae bacterium]|nr:hypothetical protein [Burkholderiaceae bacterium]